MLNGLIMQSFFGYIGILAFFHKQNYLKLHTSYLMCILWISYLFYKEFSLKNENLYSFLNLPIHTSKQDINNALQNATNIYTSETFEDRSIAEEKMNAVRRAHAILISDTKQKFYSRFADYKEEGEMDEKMAMTVICISLSHYVCAFVVAYLCTSPKYFRFARQIVLLYNISAFCFELRIRFVQSESMLLDGLFFGNFLPFEKANLLIRLFPGVFCLSLVISNFLYTDLDSKYLRIMELLLKSNRMLCEYMLQLVQNTSFLKGLSNSSKIEKLKTDEKKEKKEFEKSSLKNKEKGKDESRKNDACNSCNNLELKKYDKVKALQIEKDIPNDSRKLWKSFEDSLSDTQKQKLADFIRTLIQKPLSSDKSLIQWNQIFIWGIIIFVYVYYK